MCRLRSCTSPPNPHVRNPNSYLPLELLNNDTKHLDKADVFSLGCTLYELSTGQVRARTRGAGAALLCLACLHAP